MAISCRDVITRAIRKLNRVAAGGTITGNDLSDGMETFKALYLELVGLGTFGRMYDVVATSATFLAAEQQRILCNLQGGVDVTLPDLIDPASYPSGYPVWFDGCGCAGYDYGFGNAYGSCTPRPPRDGACVQIADLFSDTKQTWIYDRYSARWVMLEVLNASDNAPLGASHSEGLVNVLASRIASEYGMQTPPQVEKGAANGMYGLTHRFDGARQTICSEYF